jgi:6-phosphofructokinase 1
MAQSGGPTAVINNSIAGVIDEAKKHKVITGIYGAINGILGVLNEEIVDLRKESSAVVKGLRSTPSASLGSCRRKLSEEDMARILEVFKRYDIRYFFYTGGNDSMDTANKISKLAQKENYEMRVIGVPKTVDNDLVITDHCPGYGSAARFNAVAIRDAGFDTEAIYQPDTVKIYETMGRDTGWIAAASALAREKKDDAPHLIYLPERPLNLDKFLEDVKRVYDRLKKVFIAVSEGVVGEDGKPVSSSASEVDVDSFGHVQFGGASDFLCNLIKNKLNLKARFDKPGTIQRAAMDRSSKTDRDEAYLAGKTAVLHAVKGKTDFMVTLDRKKGPYKCRTGLAKLEEIANKVKKVPDEFISPSGNDVTAKFIKYARPLIGGPLPPYVRLKKTLVRR